MLLCLVSCTIIVSLSQVAASKQIKAPTLATRFCTNVCLKLASVRIILIVALSFSDAFNPAEFIDGFRQLYKIRERWLAPFPWCKEFRFHLDNIFTRLKMVINNEESGTMTVETVDMFDVFKSPKEWRRPKRVLIQGNPGIGKTTYCAKLAYDWATRTHEQEGSFPNFQVVLLLNCRDIMSGLWKAIDYQLLPQDIQEKAKDEFFKFIRINQSNVLLILDGLDELPSSQLPEILSIIEGRVLPNWHIVVTTREMAVGHYCDTVLEIKGFAEADSRMFITDYFGTMDDLAQKLLEKLEKDKQLRDMTANPFLTAVLCLLCEELEGVFQENGTQLYLEMVQCILRRYATKKELALHTEDLIGLYKAQLKDLGSIALNCLLEGSTYFEKRQLQNFASDLPGFGFLSAQREIIPWRPGIRYGFLHKSFQELFAAFYLGCQLIDGEISPESLLADTRYFRELKQVLLFTCGILAAQCEETAVALIKCIIRQVNKGGDDDFVTALYCINECKKEQSNLYIELARILAISSYLQLQNVGLKGRRLNDAPATVLAEAIKTNSTSLSKLDLSENEIGEAGTAALAEAIKLSSTLTVLNLSENGICDTGAAALAEGIKLNSTISELNLSHNEIGDTGAAALAEGMKLNSTLTELNLSQNRIGDTGAFALGEGMKLNSSLTELNLSQNRIGDTGAFALGEGMKLNSTLTELNLSENEFGDAGRATLADASKLRISQKMYIIAIYSEHSLFADKKDERKRTETKPKCSFIVNATLS